VVRTSGSLVSRPMKLVVFMGWAPFELVSI
jgi:hypothetical protein